MRSERGNFYEKIYKKAYQEIVKQSLPVLTPSLAKSIQTAVSSGMNAKKLESLIRDTGFDRRVAVRVAYQSDWVDKEEFEVLLFVAKRVFPDKFPRLSTVDRRMVYYYRRRIEVYKKIAVSSFLTEEEYLFLLKLREIAEGRLREDFVFVVETMVKAMYLMAKMKELVSKEKERLEAEEAVGFNEKLLLQFVMQNFNFNYHSKAFVKNILRSFRRIHGDGVDEEEEGDY